MKSESGIQRGSSRLEDVASAAGASPSGCDSLEPLLRRLLGGAPSQGGSAEEDRYTRAALDGLPACVLEVDRIGRVIFANQRGLTVLGLTREEDILGVTLADQQFRPFDTDCRNALGAAWRGETRELELALPLRPMVRRRRVPVRLVSIADDRADPGRVFLLAQGESQASAERSPALDGEYVRAQLLDHSPLAAIEWDADFRIRRWSWRASAMFGWASAEVEGRRFDEFPFVHPEELSRVEVGAARLKHGDALHTVRKTRNLRKGGKAFRCEWYNSVLRDGDGRLLSVLSLIHDIDDRETAKRRIRESEQRLDLALVAARMGTWEWDLARGRRVFDARSVQLLGYVPGEVEPDSAFFESRVHEDDLASVLEAREAHLRGDSPTYAVECRLRTRDAGWRWFLDRGQVVKRNAEGHPERSSGTLLDVHERHSLEGRLRHRQKMEALGTLAGGIAHDFNNILLAILGYSELALEALPAGRVERNHLQQVLNAAKRASRLVDQILAFGRQSEIKLVGLDLSEVVREAQELLRATLPSTVAVFAESVARTPLIRGDQGQLLQVLLNLGANAAHAMQETGGHLRILLDQHEELGPIGGEARPELAPGPYVRLVVDDDGAGMSDEVKSRAFDPFFTTKRPGEGTGLGLSVVHGIVRNHGGVIHLDSQPGRGTTFELYFPQLTEALEPEPPPPVIAPHQGARVLVVDDEEALADLSGRILERFGYDVTVRTTVDDALELLREEEPFDLLLTDRTMPEKDGLVLAREARALYPELPVLLVSGGGSRREDRDEWELIDHTLAKPFGAEQLAGAIQRVLRERSCGTPRGDMRGGTRGKLLEDSHEG